MIWYNSLNLQTHCHLIQAYRIDWEACCRNFYPERIVHEEKPGLEAAYNPLLHPCLPIRAHIYFRRLVLVSSALTRQKELPEVRRTSQRRQGRPTTRLRDYQEKEAGPLQKRSRKPRCPNSPSETHSTRTSRRVGRVVNSIRLIRFCA